MAIKSAFGEYFLYTLKNSGGMSVSLCDLGASVQSILVPDRNGALADVVLGYDSPQEYAANDGYLGATVGRYANRIAGAEFSLGGTVYRLTANEGSNTLHGGTGISSRRFDASCCENSVCFTLSDADGADGFPGKLRLSVRFTLGEDNTLTLDYEAVSDRDTVLNLTNHSYFNLHGGGTVLEHKLMINADSYLPVDEQLIPRGGPAPVEGTDFDFRSQRRIEKGFYDHCFVLRGSDCARLYDPASGRMMTVTTDMPAVQLYAAGMLSRRRGKHGTEYDKNCALCLETQFYPNSPNRPDFPSCVLRAGESYKSRTVYAFSAI